MLLDNEDKISVSITSSWRGSPILACITHPSFSPVNVMFITGLLICWALFSFRLTESLKS